MNNKILSLLFVILLVTISGRAESVVSLTISGDAQTAALTLKNSNTSTTSSYVVNWGETSKTVSVSSNALTLSHNYAAGEARTLTITGDLNNLAYLDCSGNNVTAMTIKDIPTLTELRCNDNQLTTLNISGLTALKVLDCSSNNLTTVPGDELSSLTTLNCSYNAGLSALPFDKITKLETLNCNATAVSDLSANSLTGLQKLSCASSAVKTLDVSSFTQLEVLDCSSCEATSLTLQGAVKLKYLYCYNNHYASLDISSLSALMLVEASNSGITTLTTGNNSKLLCLNVTKNPLVSADISALPVLNSFVANNTSLTSVTTATSSNTALDRFDVEDSKLNTLSLTNYTKLQEVNVSNNNLTSLKLSPAESAEIVSCRSNLLDIASLPDYKDISIYNYAPQKKMEIVAPAAGSDSIDLSRQNVARWGNKRAASESKYHLSTGIAQKPVYKWMTADGNKIGDDKVFMNESGVAHFSETLKGNIYCTIENPNFPELSGKNVLSTSVIDLNLSVTTRWANISYVRSSDGKIIAKDKSVLLNGASYTVPVTYKGSKVVSARIDNKDYTPSQVYEPTASFDVVVTVDAENSESAANAFVAYLTPEGKQLGWETLSITSGKYTIPTSYNTLFKVTSVTKGTQVLKAGNTYTTQTNVALTATVESPLIATTIENGQFANGTTWYLINLNNRYWNYISATSDVQTSVEGSSSNDANLWCVTGNAVDGFQFYNRKSGAKTALTLDPTTGATSMTSTASTFTLKSSAIVTSGMGFVLKGSDTYLAETSGGTGSNNRLVASIALDESSTNAVVNALDGVSADIAFASQMMGSVGGYSKAQIDQMQFAKQNYEDDANETNFTELIQAVYNQKTIAFSTNKKYYLVNVAYTGRAMTYNASGSTAGTYALTFNKTKPTANQVWIFEKNGSNSFYFKNVSSNLYLGAISASSQVSASSSKVSYVKFTRVVNGVTQWSFFKEGATSGNVGLHAASNANYKVVGWNNSENPTWWILYDADILTGIDNVQVNAPQVVEPCYDLVGRKMNEPIKGLYIRGRKKVIK